MFQRIVLAVLVALQTSVLAQIPDAELLRQQELAKQPPWQRMLTGDDAKQADVLEQRVAQLELADDHAGALPSLEKLLALRTKVQGADHYETVNQKQLFGACRKVAALDVKSRRELQAALGADREASQLEAKRLYGQALIVRRKALAVLQQVLGEDQQITANIYHHIALNLDGQGKAAEAEPFHQKALEIRRRVLGEDHPQTATSYNNLAANLGEQGKPAEAQPLSQKALEIYRRVHGEDHLDTANTYNTAASNLDELGKSAEAQPLLQKALEIHRRLLGEEHATTANSYNSLAYNLYNQGKPAEAQPLFQKALEIARRVIGEDHPTTASYYNNVAMNLIALGKAAEAQPLLQKALDINRQVFGEEHQATATSYNSLASILQAQGKAAEAQPFFQKALEINRKVLSEAHPVTANSYNGLAESLADQGKATEAQPHFQKALEIFRQGLGEDHPHTATSYNHVARNLITRGKAVEAQLLYQKALEIRRKILGENHPTTGTSYNSVAGCLSAQGKAAEALPLVQKALEITRRVLGENHPHTATIYNNVAMNLAAQGRRAEAQPLMQKALEIRRRVHGEDHSETAASYSSVASNLNAQGKAVEAQPLCQLHLEIRRRVLGEDHPDTAQSYNNVAFNLKELGNAAEAQTLYQKALDICLRVLGEDHPSTAHSYNNLAMNLNDMGKPAEAQPLLQKALEIRRRVLGEEHPETAISYNNLVINLLNQRKAIDAEPYLRPAIFAYEASRLTGATGLERASLDRFNPRLVLAGLTQAREPLSAWSEVELSLARGLLDQQANSQRGLTPTADIEWTRERERVADVQPQILALVSKAKRSDEETRQLEKLLSERRQAEERLAVLEVKASTQKVASANAIQAALPADAALLLWVDLESTDGKVQGHWSCVVRSSGDPKWARLSGAATDGKWLPDDSAVPAKLRKALAGSAPRAEVEALAEQLKVQRITPILPHLAGVKTLYVVAVNEMAGIPVELLAPQYTVSYVPSGTFLARIKEQNKPQGKSLLALADPIFADPGDKPKVPTALPPGGLLLISVGPGGVADQAGIKAGDVLLKYGDVELSSVDKLKETIAANTSAKLVPITIWREDADRPLVLNARPGKLGVVLDNDPAPVSIANRRKNDALLLAMRGGDWNDLPGTRVEAARIGKLFGENATLLADSSANEERLEELRRADELRKFRYLHFATHGAGNNLHAFESALILAQDALPKDPLPRAGEPFINGQLSAREVLDYWKLDAELVTLSACETAVGGEGTGDGPLGFAQAFLTAGSRAVCLSLWKVDDTATSLLMDRFYQNLLGRRSGLEKPMGKAAALAEAKTWLRNLSSDEALTLTADMTKGVVRGKGQKALSIVELPKSDDPDTAQPARPFAHPKYWAAFVLIGDPD